MREIRKILLLVGVVLLLVGLGTLTGVLKWETRTSWPLLSATRTLEESPGEWYDSVNVPAGWTLKITVACREAGDQVLLGLMTKAVFDAGGPWGENVLLKHSTGKDVSIGYTPPGEGGTYYFIVRGIETWPIQFDITVMAEKVEPHGAAPYAGVGLVIVGVILLALGLYHRAVRTS